MYEGCLSSRQASYECCRGEMNQSDDFLSHLDKPVAQSCAVANSEQFWRTTGEQTAGHNKSNKSFQKFGFRIHTTALWPMEHVLFCSPSLTVQWPDRIFHFYYCAWLWNCLISRECRWEGNVHLKRNSISKRVSPKTSRQVRLLFYRFSVWWSICLWQI